jgi:CheY-like chemotaxis protein
MKVAVTFPYVRTANALQAEQKGHVVRIRELSGGGRAVAIALGVGAGTYLTGASAHKLPGEPVSTEYFSGSEQKKPVVLALDSDAAVRDSLKACLTNEGYDVIALNNGPDACQALKMFTPSLVIAEMEGEGRPGYDICAFIKADHKLKHIPVVLTTSSGFPSDYANAHALGAVVCMAKPYRQERLGHVVRLLVPTIKARERTSPPRTADPSRKPGTNIKNGRGENGSNGSSLFRIAPVK